MNGVELVDGSNCATDGDQLCDTPADPTLECDSTDPGYNVTAYPGCGYFGTETDPNADSYSPDTHQFMSYSCKLCRDSWTPEGEARALNTLLTLRPNLIRCECTCDFDPNTLNFKSKGRWVTVYIELPVGVDPWEIDLSTVMLNGVVPAEMWPTDVGDHDLDGVPDRMIKFSRELVIAHLSSFASHGDQVDVTVSGELFGGAPFECTDNIRVINPPAHDAISGTPGGSEQQLVLRVSGMPQEGMVRIIFALPASGDVKLRVYDAAGRLVRTLENGHRSAGLHEVVWDRKSEDGRRVSAGVYFAMLERNHEMKVQRLLVVQ
jgi:hypothetical protein